MNTNRTNLYLVKSNSAGVSNLKERDESSTVRFQILTAIGVTAIRIVKELLQQIILKRLTNTSGNEQL